MKQLIPIDDYGMFCDLESDDIKSLKGNRVYVVKTAQGCKIGKSSNVYSRINALKGMSPVKFDGVYITKECGNHSEIERLVHIKFKDCQINSEWFDVQTDEVVCYLKTLNFKPALQNNENYDFTELFDELFTPDFIKEKNLKMREYNGNFYIEDEEGNFMLPDLFIQMVKNGLI